MEVSLRWPAAGAGVALEGKGGRMQVMELIWKTEREKGTCVRKK